MRPERCNAISWNQTFKTSEKIKSGIILHFKTELCVWYKYLTFFRSWVFKLKKFKLKKILFIYFLLFINIEYYFLAEIKDNNSIQIESLFQRVGYNNLDLTEPVNNEPYLSKRFRYFPLLVQCEISKITFNDSSTMYN